MTEARRSLRRTVALSTIFATMIGVFVLYLDLAADPNASRMQTGRFPLPVPWTILASVLLGMGLGTQITLLWSNWHRIRAVLRPNPGRVICCIVLTMLSPLMQFWGFPAATGYAWFKIIEDIFAGKAYAGLNFDEYGAIAMTLLLFMYPPLFYLFSCLIISGIRKRLLRVAAFVQVWLAAYGAVLIIFGFFSVG